MRWILKLYELNNDIDIIYNDVANQGGEITPDQEVKLELLEFTREAKLRSCAARVENMEEECGEIRDQIRRFEDKVSQLYFRLEQREKRKAGFLQYIGAQLGVGTNWSDALFSFSWHKADSVIVDPTVDVKKLPEQFITYKETYKPNKIALRKAIKKGESFEGITLEESWTLNLQQPKPKASNSETS